MNTDTVYTFKVDHTINFKYDELIHDAACSYEIELERIEDKSFRIELRQKNYKLNGGIVNGKFEKIVNEYNSTLFPVLFDRKENSFMLYNFDEIGERIKKKDEFFQIRHEGQGLDLISQTFLNLAKDGNAMVEHLFSFGLIKMIFSCIRKLQSDADFEFQWDINLIDFRGFWNGKKVFDPDCNTVKFNGELSNTTLLIEKLKQYGVKFNIPLSLSNEDLIITSSVNHEIEFVTKELDFKTSKTTTSIQVNLFFDYKETLLISAF